MIERIFAIIPEEHLKCDTEVHFKAECTIAIDSSGKKAMIVRVLNEQGRVINGIQYLADLTLYNET